MHRHFLNRLPLEPLRPLSGQLSREIAQVVERVATGHKRTGDPSVYTGSSGIAYAMNRVAGASRLGLLTLEEGNSGGVEEPTLRTKAHHLMELAVSECQGSGRRHCQSLMCGDAGVFLTTALICSSEGKQTEAEQWAQNFHQLLPDVLHCQDDEILYGKAGWLLGALILNRELGSGTIPTAALQQVGNRLLESGREWASATAEDSPLFYVWHHKAYLGVAHGLMGIVYVLLILLEQGVQLEGLKSDIEGTLRFILSLEVDHCGRPGPGGNFPNVCSLGSQKESLVHWCHGAPGAVFLFCKAYEVLHEPQYLSAAERAGKVVWDFGLLRKGPGLCHGVSGNGYALLTLHRTTQNQEYLQKAIQFGLFLSDAEFREGSSTPDRPHSLFEGWAGAACFLADLLQPAEARFPLFEV